MFNIYPPYVGAGIRVDEIADDYRSMRVSMKLRVFNRNYVGTHFGGSLYSMVDPHLMLLLMNRLGGDYVVWDQAATIRFLKPGRGTVRAHFTVSDAEVRAIEEATAQGAAHRPTWDVDIVDAEGDVVASVHKTLYVRRKQLSREV